MSGLIPFHQNVGQKVLLGRGGLSARCVMCHCGVHSYGHTTVFSSHPLQPGVTFNIKLDAIDPVGVHVIICNRYAYLYMYLLITPSSNICVECIYILTCVYLLLVTLRGDSN